jgi:hypothetical protein
MGAAVAGGVLPDLVADLRRRKPFWHAVMFRPVSVLVIIPRA